MTYLWIYLIGIPVAIYVIAREGINGQDDENTALIMSLFWPPILIVAILLGIMELGNRHGNRHEKGK